MTGNAVSCIMAALDRNRLVRHFLFRTTPPMLRTRVSLLRRPLLTLALAVALAAPVIAPSNAHAQMSRQLPSPVSAAQLETLLREVGLPETTKDAALPLHEAYFERFREFEKREVDPALVRPNDAPFDLARSVADARKEADLRRRVFLRAAQLDDQFVEELAATLPANEALKATTLRAALSRRRCAMLATAFDSAGKLLGYTLRAAPVLTQVDADSRELVALALDAYETELTRQLERYADASFARVVKAAEAREELGVGAAPEAADTEEGNAPPPGEEWFRKMRQAQRVASVDLMNVIERIRKVHREGLDQLLPLLKPTQAAAVRNHMISGLYLMLRAKSAFDSAYSTATSMREKGELDDSKWQSVQGIAESNELSIRSIVREMMDIVDKRGGHGFEEIQFFTDGQDEEDAEAKETMKRRFEQLRTELTTIENSNSEALRALLGLAQPQVQTAQQIGRDGIHAALEGALGQMGGVQIAMVGGDGEMMVLSGDDLGESGLFIGGIGGMGPTRLARPMNREELDALATKLGFATDSRAVFDEVIARCVETRTLAEKELAPAPQGQTIDVGEGGSFSFSVNLSGEDGTEVTMAGHGDNDKLSAAIDTAEETMFDELKAVCAADKADAVESGRRARARVRLLPGEIGTQAVDLVSVVERAGLSPTAHQKIASTLRTWDESSVGALRSMKQEVKALDAERERLFAEGTTETVEDDGEHSVAVTRAMKVDGELGEKLEKVQKHITDAHTRVADTNRRTNDSMVEALEGDTSAQHAVRRGFLRAANPSTYKIARDLEPYFTKATTLIGTSATAKTTVEAIHAEWIEAREVRCEEFILAQDKAKAAAGSGLPGPGEMQEMQARARERKKLREDLEQVESMVFRKLQELLIVELGAEKSKELGELPVRKRQSLQGLQFGG